MNKIKISVIIPCYNSAKFLPECLDSIMKQTFQDIEIICVNDGSTDETLNILNNYKDKDERFKIFTITHSGAACARNFGITKSCGEFLSILDSDDIFKADMLEKMYNKAVQTNSCITACKSSLLDNRSNTITPMPYWLNLKFVPFKDVFTIKDIKDHIFDIFRGWSWDKLFKRELIINNKLQFQNLTSSNDLFFVFMAIILSKRISIVEEEFIYHRMFTQTQLSETRDKNPLCFWDAIKKLQQELISKKLYNEFERPFVNWVVEFSFWQLKTIKSRKNKIIIKQSMRKQLPELLNLHLDEPDYYYNKQIYNKLNKLMHKNFLLENLLLLYLITTSEELK